MKRLLSILTLAAVGLTSTASAFDFCNCNFKETRVDLGYTFRQDSFDLDIANPQADPLLSTDYDLKDIDINAISGAFTVLTCDDILFRVKGDYGWVHSGKGTRTDNTSATPGVSVNEWEFNVEDNFVWDVSIGLGYDMTFCCDQLHVIPMFGYSWHKQKYRGSDWERTEAQLVTNGPVSPVSPEVEVAGYHEIYENKWNGFWVGLDLAYVFCCDWTLFAGVEYHQLCFDGSYSWPTTTTFSTNPISNSPSTSTHTTHELDSCGHSWLVHGGINYNFCCNWNLVVCGSYQKWTADDGFSEAFVEGGTLNALQTADISLKTWTVTAAVGYNF